MRAVRVKKGSSRHYYRIIYTDRVSRRICFCVATSLLEARRIARACAPGMKLKESSIQPTSRSQVKHEYTWLNFDERGW